MTSMSAAGSYRPEASRGAGIRETQRESGGVEVLIVELKPSEATLQGKRWLPRCRLRPSEILQTQKRNHRFHNDDGGDVLTETGVAAPSVVQVVLARAVQDERVGLGHVFHRRPLRREHKGSRGERRPAGDSRSVARA